MEECMSDEELKLLEDLSKDAFVLEEEQREALQKLIRLYKELDDYKLFTEANDYC